MKACVARLTAQYDYPDKDRTLRSYTHKIDTLVDVAELKKQRDDDIKRDLTLRLGENWLLVKDWNEQSRYRQWSEAEARGLFDAISHPNHGVTSWIMGHW